MHIEVFNSTIRLFSWFPEVFFKFLIPKFMNTCTPRYRIPPMSIKRAIIVRLCTLRIFPSYSGSHGACHQFFFYRFTRVKWAKINIFICRARNEFCAKCNPSLTWFVWSTKEKNLWKWFRFLKLLSSVSVSHYCSTQLEKLARFLGQGKHAF